MSTLYRPNLKIALFVEGSREEEGARDPLDRLWRKHITASLGLRDLDRVVGISKGNLVAMNADVKGLKRTSSIQVPLDLLMRRELERAPFDIAVVAWDLQPRWDRSAAACRWNEVKAFYKGLAHSPELPQPWVKSANARLAELTARREPTQRLGPPHLVRFSTLAVWMKPDFEGMIAHESAIRLALGVKGMSVRGWPTDWTEQGPKRMDAVLDQAIEAARKVRPKPPVFQKCGLPFRSAKHTWASLIIERGGESMRDNMRTHSTGRRLRELLMASQPL
jgi:hypothetical protein